jgi:hypothetical protein
MRISRRGERMSGYKKTITYTQVMAIVIGLALTGIGMFSVLNPLLGFFTEGTALFMTIVGVFVLLLGIMTPMGQLFSVDKRMAFVFSLVLVLVFMILVYCLSFGIGMEVV